MEEEKGSEKGLQGNRIPDGFSRGAESREGSRPGCWGRLVQARVGGVLWGDAPGWVKAGVSGFGAAECGRPPGVGSGVRSMR